MENMNHCPCPEISLHATSCVENESTCLSHRTLSKTRVIGGDDSIHNVTSMDDMSTMESMVGDDFHPQCHKCG
ncbi:hypothetical protein J6590_008286 [Homalodisca vitripennis]|nr:hypothetical protein J6590_008286 [Homalodisca vitripennis]